MTIPLDNLYDYIFSLTGHNNKNLVMYRFDPHGEKNIKNLICHNDAEMTYIDLTSTGKKRLSWHFKLIFCHDQEPLNFDLYTNDFEDREESFKSSKDERLWFNNPIGQKIALSNNLSGHPHVRQSLYDKKLLLHSEKNSKDLKKYEKNGFLGVYFWSHAFISLDWYRFAKHDTTLDYSNTFPKDFNIYCRSWTGSREYRLYFINLVKKHSIDKKSKIAFNNFSDGVHLLEHECKDARWSMHKSEKEEIFKKFASTAEENKPSSLSANYDINDYQYCAIDVVLETVYDKKKIQLTEKILRPIACGKPFILVAEANSLNYLKSYGFKTFDSLIDESYDLIEDPKKRLTAIIKTMHNISSLDESEKNKLFLKMHKIADENKKWFFSEDFFDLINGELKKNLTDALVELDRPSNQTAKLIKREYRAYRMYQKYLTGAAKIEANECILEFQERLEKSRKNILLR